MTPLEIRYRPQARQDALDITQAIAKDSVSAAEAFFAELEQACTLLATMPYIGAAHRFQVTRLEGLRIWPLRRFEKYLIFYRPTTDGLDVIRILHGARDLPSRFGDSGH